MKLKVITAVGNNSIGEFINSEEIEMIEDIPYQEGVLEIIKRNFFDVLILSDELQGDFDKYIFIDKIKEIDSKLKIIAIISKEDENYKSFLYSKGIFNIFIDGKDSVDDLRNAINNNQGKASKSVFKQRNVLDVSNCKDEIKTSLKGDIVPKFQKQQVITIAGTSSSGKSVIAVQMALILAKYGQGKVLLMDLDTENACINQILGIKREPENPEYILPLDKNSSINYMVHAIDKRSFDVNIFEKYLIKSKKFSNLDILSGNKSLYISKNILNFEYYTKILECAKSLYDFIIIDSSSNVFLDSMQFSLINANKVFFLTEGNYISLERGYRLLNEIFPAWGISNKKIRILVNKYSKSSLDKMIIEEMLGKGSISGYISFSEEFMETINNLKPVLLKNIENEFLHILQKEGIMPESDYFRRKNEVKMRFNSLISKIGGEK